MVTDSPLRVAALGGRRRGEMTVEVELADEGAEEAAPLIVVGLGELQGDRNVIPDVHGLEDNGRRSRDFGAGASPSTEEEKQEELATDEASSLERSRPKRGLSSMVGMVGMAAEGKKLVGEEQQRW
jgi:hypothetical protein